MADLTSATVLGHALAVNRIALAPMTNKQSHASGALSDAEVAWLVRRAHGGFGTIITGAWAIAPEGRVWDGQAALYDGVETHALGRLGRELAASSALGIVQLIHGGSRLTPRIAQSEGVSASAGPHWRAATEADIDRILLAHRDAARRVQAAGLNGIEVHAAHGFLPAQFLSTTQNGRTDRWGGNLVGRARLVRQIVRTIREAVGDAFVIGVRLSPEDERHGIQIEDSAQVAAWLVEDGADYLHLSLGSATARLSRYPTRHPLDLIKPALPAAVPVMVAGKIWTPDEATAALDLGADLVAIGQAAIYNPDWASRAGEPDWVPERPPFSTTRLRQVGVTAPFAAYLRESWPGSVE